jgi:hypothetical protein
MADPGTEEEKPSTTEKLTDEFGGVALLGIHDLNDFKKAFEIVEGVDEIRNNLEGAAYPLTPNDEGEGGSLNKSIGKRLGYKGKQLRDFIPTPAQAEEYIDEIVAQSADMAHAKSYVIYSLIVNGFKKHVQHLHPGASGESAESEFLFDIASGG